MEESYSTGVFYRRVPMSKTEVEDSNIFRGMSKIPRPYQNSYQYPPSNMDPGSGQSPNKPSRLMQLQNNYQRQLMREKEEKLIHMYENNANRALQKVNQYNNQNKGMVRDFLREQRQTGPRGSDSVLKPSINQQYRQRKLEHKLSNDSLSRQNNQFIQPKNSAGRDRSHPLAPIGNPDTNPFPSKPQMVRPRTLKEMGSVYDENFSDKRGTSAKSAPTSAVPHLQIPRNDSSSGSDSPPPNLSKIKSLQQKKLQQSRQNRRAQRSSPAQRETNSEMTDFQRWQKEQTEARERRLQAHRQKNTTSKPSSQDDEGYDDEEIVDNTDDIKMKQQELMEQIARQQAELERLRSQRAREEEEEQGEREREIERRRKFEEERKRKIQAEEEQRRREEEDERVKRQWEEERQRKIREEKERLRKFSERTDDDFDSHMSSRTASYKKKPHPPPQKRPPPDRVPQNPSNTPKSTAYTRIYEQAALKDPEAHDDSNVRLVPCHNCGRKFAEERIQRHEASCHNLTKKRKVLDPTTLRTAGTEMAQYVAHRRPSPKPKKSNWRAKHDSFINAIRYAKKVTEMEKQGGDMSHLPPPPASDTSDYVQCPHCTRKFNPGTAERHIPRCRDIKARPAPPRKK